MLELFGNGSSMRATILEVLDVIDSSRSQSAARLEALDRLEETFGKVVLETETQAGPSTRAARCAWWEAQTRPQSCVAPSLISLVHRLHLQTQMQSKRKAADESNAISRQLISCFTILQGLCLKDEESRYICARKSTIELLLDIIEVKDGVEVVGSTASHALDLLTCITISSPSASSTVESLQGEEIVRALMERHTAGHNDQSKGKRAVTLDQVQDNPLAVKCAEFLLFFEYGRDEERATNGTLDTTINDASLLSDSFRTAVSEALRPRPSKTTARKARDARERARSSSPVKCKAMRESREALRARREEKIDMMRSRPLYISATRSADSDWQHTPSSLESPAVRSVPVSLERQAFKKTSLTPFATSHPPSSARQDRGRSRDRSPLSLTQPLATPSPTLSPTKSSPLKSIIGPSPAVRRAHARSLSPVKKQFYSQLPAGLKKKKKELTS